MAQLDQERVVAISLHCSTCVGLTIDNKQVRWRSAMPPMLTRMRSNWHLCNASKTDLSGISAGLLPSWDYLVRKCSFGLFLPLTHGPQCCIPAVGFVRPGEAGLDSVPGLLSYLFRRSDVSVNSRQSWESHGEQPLFPNRSIKGHTLDRALSMTHSVRSNSIHSQYCYSLTSKTWRL